MLFRGWVIFGAAQSLVMYFADRNWDDAVPDSAKHRCRGTKDRLHGLLREAQGTEDRELSTPGH